MLTRAPVVTAALLLLSLAACEPEAPPESPSFQRDVLPITLSRCVRCHGGGGKLQGDPEGSVLSGPPPDGYFNQYMDSGDCTTFPSTTCKRGLMHYAGADGTHTGTLGLYIHPGGGMPPPPAPPLTEHQMEIMDAWSRNPMP